MDGRDLQGSKCQAHLHQKYFIRTLYLNLECFLYQRGICLLLPGLNFSLKAQEQKERTKHEKWAKKTDEINELVELRSQREERKLRCN